MKRPYALLFKLSVQYFIYWLFAVKMSPLWELLPSLPFFSIYIKYKVKEIDFFNFNDK